MGDEEESVRKLSRSQRRRREDILQAALKVFDEKGYEAAKMVDIAKEAEVAKGTLYLYFETKTALLEGVIRTAIIPTLQAADDTAQSHTGSAQDVLARQMKIMALRMASPEMKTLLRYMISGSSHQNQELISFYFNNVLKVAEEILRQTIKRGVANGEFRKEMAEIDPLVLLGAQIYTTVWKILFEDLDPIDTEQLAHDLMEVTMRGILQRDD